jgi:hypothetical protein
MARDNLRCLPSTRTLRRIRWPLQPRSRDHRTALSGDGATAERHSHVVLGLSRSSTLFTRTRGTRLTNTSFARHSRRRFHADDCASLGPRSLLPPPFLRALRTSLFEARMLPADFCNLKHDVRTLSSGLPIPRRDDGQDHLPFLTYHARPLQNRGCPRARRAVIRGEPHIRPPTKIPLPVLSHLRGFARPRYLSRRATSVDLRLRSSVTIDVHGSLDRAKDVSSFREPLIRRHLEECVRLAHADDVPLLILPEDTCCRRCVCLLGTSPYRTRRTGQDSHFSVRPRRLTASCESGCLSPLRLEHVELEGSLLLALDTRVGSPLTPPTRSPHGWGQCALEDIASVPVGITRQGLRRAGHLFNLVVTAR